MNAPENFFSLPDIQAQVDHRNMPIDAVGIRGVRYPVKLLAGSTVLSTVATLAMTVGLPSSAKGTHMSRFIELLEGQTEALDPARFRALLQEMLARLDAASGMIEMRFPYFVRKSAPVSGVQSQLDHEVCWRASVAANGQHAFWMQVSVPATSLCPCSKEISSYGAHNQRSHIQIHAELKGDMTIDELIGIAESGASCEIYGLLKRPDEKYVTERAYDNPKFVEDMVRDVAMALTSDPRVAGFEVEVENFESIHNHSAFARIVSAGAAPAARPDAAAS